MPMHPSLASRLVALAALLALFTPVAAGLAPCGPGLDACCCPVQGDPGQPCDLRPASMDCCAAADQAPPAGENARLAPLPVQTAPRIVEAATTPAPTPADLWIPVRIAPRGRSAPLFVLNTTFLI